jgi:hypothetical protein
MIVLNAMEQMWMKVVYEGFRERLLSAFSSELKRSINIDSIQNINKRGYKLLKTYKLLRHLEKFQSEKPTLFLINGQKPLHSHVSYSTSLETCLLDSYERVLRQALDTTDSITGYVTKVQDFKYTNFVPKYLEYTFCDMQLKFIHQAFAKHLTKLMTPYLNVPLEQQKNHVSHDMTLYSIIPYDLHGSFFMQVL